MTTPSSSCPVHAASATGDRPARRPAPPIGSSVRAPFVFFFVATVACCAAAGCAQDAPPPTPVPIACEATPPDGDAVVVDGIALVLPAGTPWLQAPLLTAFSALYGLPVDVVATRDDAGPRTLSIEVGLSDDEALAVLDSYRIARADDDGGPRLVVQGASARAAAYGAYDLLERLGARFFHPEEPLLPRLPAVTLPKLGDVDDGGAVIVTPAFSVRGTQLHTLHPLETLDSFFRPGDDTFAEAERFLDWMLATRQNHLQLFLLDNFTDAQWQHLARTIDAAHARGIDVGAVVQLWGGASLQNAYVIAEDGDAPPAALHAGVDRVLQLPFDAIELAMGEFLAADPAFIVDALSELTAYVADNHPGVDVSVVNHVGNYEDLYVDYQGEDIYYYHLPGKADSRLINNVHTVFLFDLVRPRAMYGHEDFFFHAEFLREQLQQDRRLRYIPESAYWCSADIDVPLFLPEYVRARLLDVELLRQMQAEARSAGSPGVLEGHVMFSSGHEWGYWLTDYVSARALWDDGVGTDVDGALRHAFAAFGTCAPGVTRGVRALMDQQEDLIFTHDLAAYLSTEDIHDDVGNLTGYFVQRLRLSFDEASRLEGTERKAFERDVVARLEDAAAAAHAMADDIALGCGGEGTVFDNYCRELVDGTRVTALRMQHSALLYRSALRAFGPGGDRGEARALLDDAAAARAEAADVIADREARYRYDVARLTGSGVDNGTRYPFGLYAQAHNQCLWKRQEQQLQIYIDEGRTASPFELVTCQE
jgi:hypothetical protein